MSMRPRFPALRTMSQREAEAYVPQPGDVCISITSPGAPPAALRDGWAEVLRLSFHDDCFDGWQARDEVISLEDAERVIAFVERHRDAPTLVIHCMVGASRSVSMAMALSTCYRREPWFQTWWDTADGWRVPNPGVYARLETAYRRARAHVPGPPEPPRPFRPRDVA